MLTFKHGIRRQSLSLRCADEALALELRPRANVLNATIFIPAIESVLSEFDDGETLIQVGRLELDLGHLGIAELDERLGERLTNSLREALRAALAKQGRVRRRTRDEALVELSEYFLTSGTWPAWAPRTRGMSAEELVMELVEVDPTGFVSLLRSLGGRRAALERLVVQLSLVALERLIFMLEPRHAEMVIGYLLDLECAHRFNSVVRLSEPAFHRVVWIVALAYLTRERGSQFNRRSFVKQLIGELARELGLAYDELLAALWRGLAAIQSREPLHSLPEVVDTLVGELDTHSGSKPDGPRDIIGPPQLYSLSANVDTLLSKVGSFRGPEPDELSDLIAPPGSIEAARSELRAAGGCERARLAAVVVRVANRYALPPQTFAALLLDAFGCGRVMAAVIPRVGSQAARELLDDLLVALFVVNPLTAGQGLLAATGELDRVLAGIVERLSRTSICKLVGALEPDHAAAVIGYVGELETGQRGRSFIRLTASNFTGLVWRLTLAYLIRSPGTQFNRLRYVESLVHGMATELGLAYGVLLEAMHLALVDLSRKIPLRSLPDVLEALIDQSNRCQSPIAPPVLTGTTEGKPPATAGKALLRHRECTAVLDIDVITDTATQPEDRHALEPPHLRYDRLRSLAHFLIDDDWTWEDRLDFGSSMLPDARRVLVALLAWPLLLQTAFPTDPPSARKRAVARAMAILDEQSRGQLVIALGLEGELAALADSNATAALRVSARTSTDTTQGPSQLVAGLLVELDDGGQRTVLRASERSQLRTLVRRYPKVALAFLARLHATHEHWCQRLLSEPDLTRETIVAVSGLSTAQTVDVISRLSDGLLDAPTGLLWQLTSTWLLGAYARLSPSQQMRRMVEILPISRDRVATIAAQVATACSVESTSSTVVEQLRVSLRSDQSLAIQDGDGLGSRLPASSTTGELHGREVEDLLGLVRALLSESSAGTSENDRELDVCLDALIRIRPGALTDFIEPELKRRHVREQWRSHLSESTLARIVELSAPLSAQQLLTTAELLGACWAKIGSSRSRAWLWTILLDFLGETSRFDRNLERFVQFVFSRALANVAPEQRDQLLTLARDRAVKIGLGSLRAALRPQQLQTRSPSSGPRRPGSWKLEQNTSGDSGRPIYLGNAGLVLLGPFLPEWVRRIGPYSDTTASPRLNDIDAATKAVHLLQWMVDEHCDAPEPTLVLNKILCGLAPELVVLPQYTPDKDELETCEQLLHAVIEHWGSIGNTSIAGLRETFLQREGRLERKAEHWNLKVQRKTLDVLVDQIPWTTSVIALAWMPEPIYVSW